MLKDESFNLIRELPILETRPEHLLKVIEVGTVSTNVFLRRVHNFALDMGWLPWTVIPKKHWPKVPFRDKRAITLEEHQAILNRQMNPVWNAFYQLCWLLDASQSDVAFLSAQDVDWQMRVIGFARKKTKTISLVHFDEDMERVLKTLPASGPLFPHLRKMNSRHRATEFTRICRRAGAAAPLGPPTIQRVSWSILLDVFALTFFESRGPGRSARGGSNGTAMGFLQFSQVCL